VKPYYSDDWVTIYHGDCREIVPTLGEFDLLLTDPPYGIARVWKGGFKNGWSKSLPEQATRNLWDGEPPSSDIWPMLLGKAKESIVWGGNYFPLPPSRGWLVWVKPERNFTMSEAELAWTSIDTVVRVWESARHVPAREHPTQKPLELMTWSISKCGNPKTILDPFAGSGSTGRAAKDLLKSCVLVEREEKYCEMSARRMAQEVMNFA